ncbi:MAG: hypothetical protein HQL31_08510 [Planctomycetes bacterium]|nr:hypothetical protein [Planctomycetota bacterium]
MFQRQFLGYPRNDPFLTKAADNLSTAIPTILGGDWPAVPYEIYYGTLAAFQTQGTVWNKWNLAMKKILLNAQRKGDTRILGGSWDPENDEVGSHGGRVLVTALYCLCLEVYYRYETMN